MAKIPMGNFGQSMPNVERINLPQNQSGQIIGAALQNVSQITDKIAEDQDKEQREREVSAKRLELYHNDLDKRDGQLKVDEVLTTDFSDQVSTLKNQVGNGALTSDQANAQLKTWSDERFAQMRPELPTHAQKDYQDYWNATVNKQSGSFFPLQIKATEQKELVMTDRAFDIATRLGRKEGAEYLGNALLKSNISEATKQEKMFNYEVGRDKLEVESGIEDAFAAGNIDALKQVQGSLKDKKYLDGATVQRYSASISSKVSTLQQRAEIEEKKRVNEAGKVFNNFKQAVMTGSDLGEELIANTQTAVKGTEHEADFNLYLKQSKNFQSFSKLSTSDQLKQINTYKAQQKNSKSNDPDAENKIMSVYENIYSDKLKTAKENPTQALQEAGIKVPELNPATIKANPAEAAKTIATAGSYQVAMRDKDPNFTIKPISPEALPAAKQAFDGMSVNQKLDFIGQQITATKGMKGGDQIWKESLKQLGGDDRTYYLAGLARAKNRKLGNEDLATTLINGKHLVDNGKYVLPSELETSFREKYGNLVGHGSFDDDFKSFQLAYATIANRNGVLHPDKKDMPDKKTIEKAFELTTGGVYKQSADGWFGGFRTTDGGSFKSWMVPKPYGWSDDKFEAHLSSSYSSLSKMSGYSVNDLRGFRLVPRIDRNSDTIMYNLINQRGDVLKSSDGKYQQFIIFNGVTR